MIHGMEKIAFDSPASMTTHSFSEEKRYYKLQNQYSKAVKPAKSL